MRSPVLLPVLLVVDERRFFVLAALAAALAGALALGVSVGGGRFFDDFDLVPPPLDFIGLVAELKTSSAVTIGRFFAGSIVEDEPPPAADDVDSRFFGGTIDASRSAGGLLGVAMGSGGIVASESYAAAER